MNKIADSIINIRVDKKTKDKAQKTLEEMGLDLSSGIKLFLNNVIITESIPFQIKTKNGFTQVEELEMVKQTQEAIKSKKEYQTAEGLHKGILK